MSMSATLFIGHSSRSSVITAHKKVAPTKPLSPTGYLNRAMDQHNMAYLLAAARVLSRPAPFVAVVPYLIYPCQVGTTVTFID